MYLYLYCCIHSKYAQHSLCGAHINGCVCALLQYLNVKSPPFVFTRTHTHTHTHTHTSFYSIHDRKVSVLGLCTVMQCQLRPEAVLAIAPEMVPAVVLQLDGLKDAYQSKFIS